MTDSSAEPPASPWRRRTLVVLFLLSILSVTDRQILSLMVLPIQRDLGLSDVQLGLLQGLAFAVFYSVGGLFLGAMIDRYSRRLVIFLGVVTWSLSAAACGLANSFWTLFGGRVGVGAGEGVLMPGSYSILSDIYPRDRLASALGFYHMGGPLGVAASLAFGGLLIGLISEADGFAMPLLGQVHAWQATFILTGLPGLLAAMLIFTFPEPARRHSPIDKLAGEGSIAPVLRFLRLRPGATVCHLGAFALLTLCAYAIAGWAPAFMGRKFGWEPQAIGLGLAVSLGGGGVLAAGLGGLSVDALFRRGVMDAHFRVHIFTTAIGASCAVGAFLCNSAWLFLVLLGASYMTLTSFTPSAAASLQLMAPSRIRGRLSSIYAFTITMVGLGLGPLLVALATDYLFRDRQMVGESVALVIGVVAPVVMVLLAVGMKPYRAAVAEAA